MLNVRRSGFLLASLLVAACASPPPVASGGEDTYVEVPVEAQLPPGISNVIATPPPPPAIDRERELLVTDVAVLSGARSDNGSASAPWSFRHVMEALAAESSVDAPTFVNDWLATWQASSTGASEGSLPLGARPDVQKDLVCPWLRLTPENACDDTCAHCAAYSKLDLSRAPFRLLAIVNRLDLAETTTGCKPEASEGRLLFVAMRPGTSTPLSFNAIFEYVVNGTVAGAPDAWHALAALRGADYAAALEKLTRSFTDGARLGQLRTSENLAGASWELRQFAYGSGRLVPTALTNTIKDALDGTPELATHVNGHESQIFAGDNAVPPTLATAFSTMPKADFKWSSTDANPSTLHLFGLSTCNGCHAGERGDTSVLPFSHVGVDASGATIVSRFLSDPSAPDSDELAFRGRSLARRLTGGCGSSEASYGGRHGLGGGDLKVTPDNVASARRVH
ncbi:MAG: putative lipoprotein [Myxococcales bacterium]|nr:putative lipoprotein [Myxococcales bacterium]